MDRLLCTRFNIQSVPESYIVPPEKRATNLIVPSCRAFPVVDLGGEDGWDRMQITQQILEAIQEFGFFQVLHLPFFILYLFLGYLPLNRSHILKGRKNICVKQKPHKIQVLGINFSRRYWKDYPWWSLIQRPLKSGYAMIQETISKMMVSMFSLKDFAVSSKTLWFHSFQMSQQMHEEDQAKIFYI